MAQVMRDSQAVRFNVQQRDTSLQSSGGYVNPDFTKHEGEAGRLKTVTDVHNDSGLDKLVSAVAGAAVNYGAKKMDQMQEEAYLNGQAAAAAGKSKDEIESNIFTSGWATRGWGDTKARLSLADADAQTAVDMKKLREQDPEKMKEYLQTRREGLMPLMQDMSMEARKGMMAQMLLSDQHAIAKHMTEHSKFIIDQQSKAVQTSFSVANDAMNASKGDPQAYSAATNAAMGNLWANVIQNPNLPSEVKSKLIEDAATLALTNNNEQLYEKMRDLKDPQGVSLLDQLSFDSQVKLAKAYQGSQKDTATLRTSAYTTQLGLYQSKLDDPLAEPVSWEDHQVFVQQGVQIGVVGQDKIASLAKQWADGQAKKQRQTSAAAAYAAGDINAMFSMGVTEEEGAQAWVLAQQRKGATPAQATTALAQIGVSTGQLSAFSTVGKMMRSSIISIGASETIDPGQLEGVNAVLATIDSLEGKDKNGAKQSQANLAAKTAFLSSFDDDTQARLLTYWDSLKLGRAPSVAAAEAATRATENATLSKSDKAALAAGHSKENQEILADITPKGLFAQAWEKVVPDAFRFNDNINKDKLRADKSWFENPERVEEAQARGKVALLQELNDVSRAHPYMSADSRKSMALTKVAARTITTDGGPLILPQGSTVQTYFGVPTSVSPDVVASTLNAMHQPGKGNRTVYTVMSDGRLQWQEKNKDGLLVNPGGLIDPRTVGPQIQAEQDKLTEKYIQTDGYGVQSKGTDGAAVRYNGNNTIGIGTNVMLQYRKDLVQFEAVRNTPYDDASGKIVDGKRVQTVGVGVSSHNPFYPKVGEDGKVSNLEISRSFMRASDAAMKSANESMNGLPQELKSTYTTRLYGQLAYQGGSVPKSLVQAMEKGDRKEAEAALRNSPQYKMAHKERKQFYDNMFGHIMPFNS